MKNKCMLVAALLLLSGTISAKVVLPPMFSDNMVLQQQADAPIWGEAKPMKAVKVTTSWDGKTYETLADKEVEERNDWGGMDLFRTIQYGNAAERLGQGSGL